MASAALAMAAPDASKEGLGDVPPADSTDVRAVREAFETALTSAGLHCSDGGSIWSAYEAFELRLLAGAL